MLYISSIEPISVQLPHLTNCPLEARVHGYSAPKGRPCCWLATRFQPVPSHWLSTKGGGRLSTMLHHDYTTNPILGGAFVTVASLAIPQVVPVPFSIFFPFSLSLACLLSVSFAIVHVLFPSVRVCVHGCCPSCTWSRLIVPNAATTPSRGVVGDRNVNATRSLYYCQPGGNSCCPRRSRDGQRTGSSCQTSRENGDQCSRGQSTRGLRLDSGAHCHQVST